MDNHRLTGIVQSGGTGGTVPLAGARVTLYDATANAPKVIGSATTDGSGWFATDHDPDPSAGTIFYATASLPGNILLVNVIGPRILGPIVINELTTVAAAFALAQFITPSGAIAGNTTPLRVASGMNDNLVSPLTGQSSAVLLAPPNADETNSLQSTRALGNLLAPTVQSRPGAWDTLRQLTTPPGGPAPADTFQAALSIARNPINNVDQIFQQSHLLEIYQPNLGVQPDAWTLAVKVTDTGDHTPEQKRIFGGPANISWDANGYAWVANNVFQGTPNSCDFVVVLKPNGQPSDGTNGTPLSPVVCSDIVGPGYGVSVDPDGNVWVGSFGWGPSDTFPTSGIVTKFDAGGTTADSYTQATERIQGTVADAQGHIWMSSYGNNAVVVYPFGNADTPISYPDQNSPASPATMPFGIAVRAAEPGTAWVTYGGGLGWPTAYDGYVARFTLGNSALQRTLFGPVGKALKGLTLDQQGNAWVASGGDGTVYMVTPDGDFTGFSGQGGVLGPWGVAVDGNNDVWVANFGVMGVTENYTDAGISKLAGVGSPSGLAVGTAITPESGYTLPTGGDPVTLPNGDPLYDHGHECKSPLMRMTSVTIDVAGNIWAVNNWKPRFGTDFPPANGNPGGDGIVIFVGLAKPVG